MPRCPQCQTLNPQHARFCSNCGSTFVLRCAGCNRILPKNARFCPNCGAVVEPPRAIPWVDRNLAPGVRRGLTDAARGVGITLLIAAALVAVFTPPWEILMELIMLIAGASLLLLAHYLNPGRKPKPVEESEPDTSRLTFSEDEPQDEEPIPLSADEVIRGERTDDEGEIPLHYQAEEEKKRRHL